MPFLQEGGSVEAGFITGPVGYGLPAAQLIVDPDKIIELQREIEGERDRVRDWLDTNRSRLNSVPPPGTDPCSDDSVTALGENGQTALDAAQGYVAQLKSIAEQLGEIAKEYNVTEDESAEKFPWDTK